MEFFGGFVIKSCKRLRNFEALTWGRVNRESCSSGSTFYFLHVCKSELWRWRSENQFQVRLGRLAPAIKNDFARASDIPRVFFIQQHYLGDSHHSLCELGNEKKNNTSFFEILHEIFSVRQVNFKNVFGLR